MNFLDFVREDEIEAHWVMEKFAELLHWWNPL